jgi:hypothetical protein
MVAVWINSVLGIFWTGVAVCLLLRNRLFPDWQVSEDAAMRLRLFGLAAILIACWNGLRIFLRRSQLRQRRLDEEYYQNRIGPLAPRVPGEALPESLARLNIENDEKPSSP